MTRLRQFVLAVLTCTATPVFAQTGLPMCYDSTRAAYYPRATRAGDSLVSAKRTATTFCVKPMHEPMLVRVGPTDSVTVQAGAELAVEFILPPGIGALQATLGYATSRLTLNDPNGNARMQWIAPWFGGINPTTRVFNLVYAPPDSLRPVPTTINTAARAYFVVRPTIGRTNVTLTISAASDAVGKSVVSRVIVRNLVVCVVRC